jgi:hypothetical protein
MRQKTQCGGECQRTSAAAAAAAAGLRTRRPGLSSAAVEALSRGDLQGDLGGMPAPLCTDTRAARAMASSETRAEASEAARARGA